METPDEIHHRVSKLEVWREQAELRFERLNIELRDNTLMTAAVKSDTAQLIELFKAAKVNLRVLKWLAGVASGVGAIWAAWRHLP